MMVYAEAPAYLVAPLRDMENSDRWFGHVGEKEKGRKRRTKKVGRERTERRRQERRRKGLSPEIGGKKDDERRWRCEWNMN
ncbi:hypothetical protein TNCV_3600041 [Trichonephila clavipes]|nr:hypothetical protein TNCV_3600041 [Trichonephila clavipes]